MTDESPIDESATPFGKPKCTAIRSSNGKPCGNYPMTGGTVCHAHGGKAPQTMAKAARNVQQTKALKVMKMMGAPVETNPVQALIDLISDSARLVGFYREQFESVAGVNIDDLVFGVTKHEYGTGPKGSIDITTKEAAVNVWLQLYNEEKDRLARYSSTAIKAGFREREVRMAEQQSIRIGMAVRNILNRLNLSPEQQALVPTVVPEELRALVS